MKKMNLKKFVEVEINMAGCKFCSNKVCDLCLLCVWLFLMPQDNTRNVIEMLHILDCIILLCLNWPDFPTFEKQIYQ